MGSTLKEVGTGSILSTRSCTQTSTLPLEPLVPVLPISRKSSAWRYKRRRKRSVRLRVLLPSPCSTAKGRSLALSFHSLRALITCSRHIHTPSRRTSCRSDFSLTSPCPSVSPGAPRQSSSPVPTNSSVRQGGSGFPVRRYDHSHCRAPCALPACPPPRRLWLNNSPDYETNNQKTACLAPARGARHFRGCHWVSSQTSGGLGSSSPLGTLSS